MKSEIQKLELKNAELKNQIEKYRNRLFEFRHMKTVIDNAQDAIISKTMDGKILSWNKGAQTIYGYSTEQVLGRNISLLCPKDRRDEIAEIMKRVQAGEHVDHFETIRKNKYGKLLNMSLSISPVKDDLGNIVAASTIGRDITEKKQADLALIKSKKTLEKKVAESTKELKKANEILKKKISEIEMAESKLKKLSLAIEQSPSTVVITDLDGKIEYANPSFSRITGYSLEEAFGENPRIMKSGFHTPDFYEHLWYTISSGKVWCGEICNKKKNGDLYWELISISPVKTSNGAITHYVAVKEDITERKEKEAELEKAKEKADSANTAKSAFMANMSHEIRTPLNAIIGMTHLALETHSTSKQQDYLSKISTASQSLLSILNDILDFSKIEAGRLELEHIEFPLDTILNRVRDIFGIKIMEKGLKFHFNVQTNVPLRLIGDPLRLSQVLNNLIGNAIKFTEKGTVGLNVELLEEKKDTVKLQFSVHDTGIGMNQKQQNDLFQAFSQADISTTRRYGGTGLGLAITKKIVLMMAGGIWVKSESGRGSEFVFTALFGLARGSKSLSPLDVLKGIRLLIVEDEDQVRYLIKKLLSIEDLEAMTASSSEEAIKILENQPGDYSFHGYIVDWHLNEKTDGLQLISRLKKHPMVGNKSKFILMSGYLSQEIQQAEDTGEIDGFLSKPLTPKTIIGILKEVFNQEPAKRSNGIKVVPKKFDIPPSIRGARILLVEDNVLNQQVASEMLRNKDFEVIIAGDGQQAIDILDKQVVDAVLMDVQMPVKDGYTSTKEIRQDKRFGKLPIIAMSAFALSADMEKSIKIGMNDHISKPFQADQLMAKLIKWIEPMKSKNKLSDNGRLVPTPDGAHLTDLEKKSDFPKNIPGLHVQKAKKYVDGNAELYRDLLEGFYENYFRSMEEIENALSAGDKPVVNVLVHKIKGIAGTIGAVELYTAAEKMELAFLQKDVEAVQQNKVEFQKNLKRVLSGIHNFLEKSRKAKREKAETGNPKELFELLKELEIHIKKRGAGECLRIMKKILKKSWSKDMEESLNILIGYLDTFQFKKAWDKLESIKEKLD